MPAGFRRSRALWDETKRLDHTTSSRLYATLRAILYELQPIRFSQVNWFQMMRTARDFVLLILRGISYLPGILRVLAKFLWQRKLGCLGVLAYYFAVRWIHEVLEAGPMVVMFTALIGIFTIGLSDDNDNPEGLSAYSVFNRGFERLLGSVDADALLAQHVGMGPGAALPVMGDDDDDAPRLHRRRPRRQERAAAPRAEAQDNNNNNNDDDDDDDNNNNNEDDEQADAQPRNNRARKSGKKARRRNLEQRRDRQRQREAAMTLGMQGAETEQEMIEMQRLIENQIAEANGEN